MESVKIYFLNYRFNIYIDEHLSKRFSMFWKSFLLKENGFETTNEWNIYFENADKPSTKIDYEQKNIYHYHNSICDLTELNNLVRETIVKISAMDGMVWLHCSGFKLNGKTFLVIGNKGDGKTTMLLNALLNGAEFIGNDQLPLFIHNKEIYTYTWRPDIKIAKDYAIDKKIVNDREIQDEEKVIYLVNNKAPYTFIDTEKMSKRIGKKISMPDNEINIKLPADRINKVDYLIFLDSTPNIETNSSVDILERIKDDKETIFTYKLEDMEKYMPYWNKRIKDIKISKNASEENENILSILDNQVEKIICGKRIQFEMIKNYLDNLLERK